MAEQKQRKSNRNLVLSLVGLVVFMFAFGYAMVPLYNVVCRAFGINGKTSNEAVAVVHTIDKSRTVVVQFLTTNNARLPWKFYPKVRSVDVHPGQSKRIAFYAENDSDKTMTIQAVPSVTPGNAANYLKKTECFCFDRQTLKSKQSVDMPLLFHIDADLPKRIHTITLAYTLFDVTHMKRKAKKAVGKLS